MPQLADRSAHTKTNLILFTFVVSIALFGLIILFSTSSFSAHKSFGDAYYYIKKQSIFILIGLFLLIISSQVTYRIWYHLAWPLYIFSITLLLLVFVPSIGKQAGGANRWISIAGVSHQPSDLARFAMVLLMARFFTKGGAQTENETSGKMSQTNAFKTLLSLFVISLPVLLISLEPDFGTAFHLITVAIFFLFLTDFSLTVLITIGVSAIPIIYYNVVKIPWRLKRIIAFLDPWEYRYEEGYQLVAALKSFLAGGLWGKGLGESIIRHRLQARHTDFILAVVAEDLGLIGVMILLTSFIFIMIYGVILLKKVQDSFGKLLGMGILLIFIFQAAIHISVNMGLLPTTGINLPLISYGGTSIVTYLFMFGVLLNICRWS